MSRAYRCTECGFSVPADQMGAAMMRGHLMQAHPLGDPGFPEHEHLGDSYDQEHCVYTRADGERCWHPLTTEQT